MEVVVPAFPSSRQTQGKPNSLLSSHEPVHGTLLPCWHILPHIHSVL